MQLLSTLQKRGSLGSACGVFHSSGYGGLQLQRRGEYYGESRRSMSPQKQGGWNTWLPNQL